MAQCTVCGLSAGIQEIHPDCEKLLKNIGIDAAQKAMRLDLNTTIFRSILSSSSTLPVLAGFLFPFILIGCGLLAVAVVGVNTDFSTIAGVFAAGAFFGLLPASILFIVLKMFAQMARIIATHIDSQRS